MSAGLWGPAHAQTDAAAQTVVVTGRGAEQRAFDTPYAVDVIDGATLRSSGPMVNLSEALVHVPGVVANLRNNYAQDLQISSRGFGARASFGVRGMRLYSDGIPAAGPDGQGQVSHFDIAGAERLEVLRGPFSALYGNSSGSVIALVSSAPRQREWSIDGDAGSSGLRQARATLAAPLEGGFSVRASATSFAFDGFRPQMQARRSLLNLRLGFDSDADRVTAVFNSLEQPAQDPLGLTRERFDADPRQTTPEALQFNTRKNTAQDQAGVQWQHRFADAGPLERSALALYGGVRSVTQWQAIPVATQLNARHPGGVIDFTRHYEGLDARLFWKWSMVRAVTGVSLDDQNEDRRGYENFTGTGALQVLGVTGRLRRDENNSALSRDLYAQAEVDLPQVLPGELTATAGIRQGRLRIRSTDRYLSNGDDSGEVSFTAATPVAGLRWQPFAPSAQAEWNLYASVARGSESPTLNELAYRPDGNAGFNTALKQQRSRQWEVGSKWRSNALGLSADVALFDAETRDELGVQTNSGGRSTYQNVGRTTRRGIELSAAWRVAAQWRLQASASRLNARYRDDFLTCNTTPCATPAAPVAAGNRIAGTLPWNGFVDLAWSPGAAEFGVEYRAQGRQPVDDLNSDFARSYGMLGLRAQYRWQLPEGRLELLARVDNLTDRQVAGSVIVSEANRRFFEPAAGRNGLVSLRWVRGF